MGISLCLPRRPQKAVEQRGVGSLCLGQIDGPAAKSASFYALLGLSCMSSAGYLQGSAFTSDRLSCYFSNREQ